MIEMNSTILDDGNEYFILSEIVLNGNSYTLFSNVNDDKDVKIRKVVFQGDKQYYIGIDDNDELKNVIVSFDKNLNS